MQTGLELLPDAAILVDREGRIIYTNAQTNVLFGYAQGELLNRPVEVLMPERFNRQHVEDRQQYTLQPTRRVMGQRGKELSGRRKDGSEFPVDIAIGPFEAAGNGPFVLAVIRDMTERKRIEETLRKDKDALERDMKIMMDREGRVVELKQEINALLQELGRPKKYTA